ncbi:hypothetical protein SNEBB_000260 [Seison nebaliae]|nr:hypothetical protein SNEBB_000260 [Seison nebaliae]
MSTKVDVVLKYLIEQERPYNVNDIFQNLHKKYKIPFIQKSLENLRDDNKIVEKIYGKQKIYCYIKEIANDNELVEMKENLRIIKDENKKLYEKKEILLKDYEKLKIVITNCDLDKMIMTNKEKIEKLNKISFSNDTLSDGIKVDLKLLKKLKSTLKDRKNKFYDIFDGMLENSDMSKEELLTKIGINDQIARIEKLSI